MDMDERSLREAFAADGAEPDERFVDRLETELRTRWTDESDDVVETAEVVTSARRPRRRWVAIATTAALISGIASYVTLRDNDSSTTIADISTASGGTARFRSVTVIEACCGDEVSSPESRTVTEGQIDFTTGEFASRSVDRGDEGDGAVSEWRLVDRELYATVPGELFPFDVADSDLEGASWLRWDFPDFASDLESMISFGRSVNDPSALLERLRADSHELESLGADRYRATVTRGWVMGVPEGGSSVAELDRFLAQPAELNIRIDGGRVVELRTTIPGSDETATERTSTEFFDFGTPVKIEAPDPADVIDFSLLGRMMGSSIGEVPNDDVVWSNVVRGTEEGFDWSVAVSGNTSVRCYHVEIDPDFARSSPPELGLNLFSGQILGPDNQGIEAEHGMAVVDIGSRDARCIDRGNAVAEVPTVFYGEHDGLRVVVVLGRLGATQLRLRTAAGESIAFDEIAGEIHVYVGREEVIGTEYVDRDGESRCRGFGEVQNISQLDEEGGAGLAPGPGNCQDWMLGGDADHCVIPGGLPDGIVISGCEGIEDSIISFPGG
jgi:hypothetical protein